MLGFRTKIALAVMLGLAGCKATTIDHTHQESRRNVTIEHRVAEPATKNTKRGGAEKEYETTLHTHLPGLCIGEELAGAPRQTGYHFNPFGWDIAYDRPIDKINFTCRIEEDAFSITNNSASRLFLLAPPTFTDGAVAASIEGKGGVVLRAKEEGGVVKEYVTAYTSPDLRWNPNREVVAIEYKKEGHRGVQERAGLSKQITPPYRLFTRVQDTWFRVGVNDNVALWGLRGIKKDNLPLGNRVGLMVEANATCKFGYFNTEKERKN